MIAVFVRSQREFLLTCRFRAPGGYKLIESVEDIRGRKFNAVLELYGWSNDYTCTKKIQAFEMLKQRQPELWQ